MGGAYATLQEKFGQLPGTGETITNISVGDLTDASMDDGEVATYGPTTLLQNGQRYIDLPTMPLIPAYVAEPDGSLSGTASVEGTGDPVLGEIGLDFSVMAPLPDGDQRAGDTGLRPHRPARHRARRELPPRGSRRRRRLREIAQAFVAAATQTAAARGHHRQPRLRHRRPGFPGPLPRRRPGHGNGHRRDRAALRHHRRGLRQRRHPAVHADRGRAGRRRYADQRRARPRPRPPTSTMTQSSTTPSRGHRQRLDRRGRDHRGRHARRTAAGRRQRLAEPDVRRDPHGRQRQLRQRLGTAGDAVRARRQHPRLRAPRPGRPTRSPWCSTAARPRRPEIAAAAADVLQAARLTHQRYGPAQVIKVLQADRAPGRDAAAGGPAR